MKVASEVPAKPAEPAYHWTRGDTAFTVAVSALFILLVVWLLARAPPTMWVGGVRYTFTDASVELPTALPGAGSINETTFGGVQFRFWVESLANDSNLILAGMATAPNLPTGWFSVASAPNSTAAHTWIGPASEFGVIWAGNTTVRLLVQFHDAGI